MQFDTGKESIDAQKIASVSLSTHTPSFAGLSKWFL